MLQSQVNTKPKTRMNTELAAWNREAGISVPPTPMPTLLESTRQDTVAEAFVLRWTELSRNAENPVIVKTSPLRTASTTSTASAPRARSTATAAASETA